MRTEIVAKAMNKAAIRVSSVSDLPDSPPVVVVVVVVVGAVAESAVVEPSDVVVLVVGVVWVPLAVVVAGVTGSSSALALAGPIRATATSRAAQVRRNETRTVLLINGCIYRCQTSRMTQPRHPRN